MAGIVRATAKLFATTGLTPVGGFAAAANGTVTTEVGSLNSLSNIQGGQPGEWAAGWLSATLGSSKFPAIEDMNAVDSVFSTQIAYILERGIAEYDSGTSYNIGDVTRRAATFQTYKSLTDTNLGNALPAVPLSSTNWQYCGDLSAIKIPLTGDTSFYVATTGNDSNPGSVASPWLTIQHAVTYILSNIDTAGHVATIVVADGTYTGNVLMDAPITGGGSIQLQGNNATPANCILSTTGTAVQVQNNAVLYIKGFKITVATSGNGLQAQFGGIINVNGNMNYSACAGAQIGASAKGYVNITANYTISGSAAWHWLLERQGVKDVRALTITLSGTPAFSTAFAASDGSYISCSGNTFSGSATGVRFAASNNGVINTGGGGSTYLPGNSAGTGTNAGTAPYGLYV